MGKEAALTIEEIDMPAYRERVYICPAENGQPGWVEDFPLWWERTAFFEQYGRRSIDTGNPIYADHALLLIAWEARTWDKRCREEFAHDPRSQEPFFVESLRHWETMLGAASWVIVESYEWESGLSWYYFGSSYFDGRIGRTSGTIWL